MIRATTIGVLKTYRSNLNNSFSKLNSARETVLTQRAFNSYAEDPAAAARAFQLRRSRMAVESQYTVNDATYRKYQSAWGSLDTVSKLIDTENGTSMSTLKDATLEWLDDPKGDARTQLAKVLDQLSQTIVQSMNSKYGDSFIFSGADGQNVPFTIENNKLYYRGVPVDAAVPDVLTVTDGAGQEQKLSLPLDADGNYDPAGDAVYFSARAAALVDYDPANVPENALTDGAGNPVVLDSTGQPFTDLNALNAALAAGERCSYVTVKEEGTISPEDYEQACSDAEKLEYLSNEAYYVDIGLGFKENANDELIKSSGFNAALQGINFLGYGQDEDGDPKNIYSIVQRLKEISDSVPEGGSWNSAWPEFDRLVGKLEIASSNFKTEYTNMDASTGKLENNAQLLEDQFYTLQEQYSGLEDVDAADAISAFLWAQYSYNAALRVGNNVLSQSLMDYIQ